MNFLTLCRGIFELIKRNAASLSEIPHLTNIAIFDSDRYCFQPLNLILPLIIRNFQIISRISTSSSYKFLKILYVLRYFTNFSLLIVTRLYHYHWFLTIQNHKYMYTAHTYTEWFLFTIDVLWTFLLMNKTVTSSSKSI